MKHVDVAIIGGSLAGATCMRELRRLGIDAVAYERDLFPREKVCGGFLSPGALDTLRRLDLLDDVRRAGAVEVRSARIQILGTETRVPFRRPGLGISRLAMDAILARHAAVQHAAVLSVLRTPGGFGLRLSDGREISARVVVDGAGKLTRFNQLAPAEQFGVQFYESGLHGDVMDFWFFPDGYGGIVSVEANRSNACFLVRKESLPRYLSKPDCRVTGPVAYDARRTEFIGIGDAAGMIDPFCGEGMHHALDTGRLAARSVATGLKQGWDYRAMHRHYDLARSRRWGAKRMFAATLRRLLAYPRALQAGMRWNSGRLPDLIVNRFWNS